MTALPCSSVKPEVDELVVAGDHDVAVLRALRQPGPWLSSLAGSVFSRTAATWRSGQVTARRAAAPEQRSWSSFGRPVAVQRGLAHPMLSVNSRSTRTVRAWSAPSSTIVRALEK